MKRKIGLISMTALILSWIIIYFGNDMLVHIQSDQPSISLGTPADGSLMNGKRLPTNGNNFIVYSRFGALLGRNFVHNKVRDVLLESYKNLEAELPNVKFVYGETAWYSGGRFFPHKTHRNGLSVDFFVPVMNKTGQSIIYPCSVFNKFGYAVEFDSTGKNNLMKIDFESMAKHINRLIKACKRHGIKISRVIFDPKLQPLLFATQTGKAIKDKAVYSTKPSWVRHDEHYHIDFEVIP